MQYRRAYIKGACYFFTVDAEKRHPIFRREDQVEVLRQAFRQVKPKYPFHIDAMVVLPFGLCRKGMRIIRPGGGLSKHGLRNIVIGPCIKMPNQARKRKQQQEIWQHRYWEHVIRDETDYQHHIDYIHYNPVKHGYLQRAADGPFSSLRNHINRGIVP
jgi:putative transposase